MSVGACVLCGFTRLGEHEPWCPHFMRGPDAGGDPAEWSTLFELPAPGEVVGRGVGQERTGA